MCLHMEIYASILPVSLHGFIKVMHGIQHRSFNVEIALIIGITMASFIPSCSNTIVLYTFGKLSLRWCSLQWMNVTSNKNTSKCISRFYIMLIPWGCFFSRFYGRYTTLAINISVTNERTISPFIKILSAKYSNECREYKYINIHSPAPFLLSEC